MSASSSRPIAYISIASISNLYLFHQSHRQVSYSVVCLSSQRDMATQHRNPRLISCPDMDTPHDKAPQDTESPVLVIISFSNLGYSPNPIWHDKHSIPPQVGHGGTEAEDT